MKNPNKIDDEKRGIASSGVNDNTYAIKNPKRGGSTSQQPPNPRMMQAVSLEIIPLYIGYTNEGVRRIYCEHVLAGIRFSSIRHGIGSRLGISPSGRCKLYTFTQEKKITSNLEAFGLWQFLEFPTEDAARKFEAFAISCYGKYNWNQRAETTWFKKIKEKEYPQYLQKLNELLNSEKWISKDIGAKSLKKSIVYAFTHQNIQMDPLKERYFGREKFPYK